MEDHTQLTMIPVDRAIISFDVHAIGPSGQLAITHTVKEGSTETLVVLETAGFDFGSAGELEAARWIAGRLLIALTRVSPF